MTVVLLRALDGAVIEGSSQDQERLSLPGVQGGALKANLLRRKAQKLRRQGIVAGEV